MEIILDIKVITNSGFSKFAQDNNGKILAYVKSAPEKGKANRELIKNLSKKLKLPQANIDIIKGLISKYKKIKIESSLDKAQLLAKLNLDVQKTLF